MATDELKKCSVRIGGVYYQLVTSENEQYTRQIAAHADEMINRVMQDNPQLSQAMATVLSLVNAVDELSRVYQQMQSMEGQQLDLDHKSSEAHRELNRLREQNWEMKKELMRVQELNRDCQTLINKLTEPGTNGPDGESKAADDAAPDAGPPDGQADHPEAVVSEKESQAAETDPEPDGAAEPEPEPDDPEGSRQDEEESDKQDPWQEPAVEKDLWQDPVQDPARLPLDRLQQTNLDDYLRDFGPNSGKPDAGPNSGKPDAGSSDH